MLVDLAARHDARELRIIGKRILDTVAPESAPRTRSRCCRRRVPRRRGCTPCPTTARARVTARSRPVADREDAPAPPPGVANPARHTEAELRTRRGVEAAAAPAGGGVRRVRRALPGPRPRRPRGERHDRDHHDPRAAPRRARHRTARRRTRCPRQARLACEANIIPWCSTASPSRSTSAAPPGCSRRPNASPSGCVTAAAPQEAARPSASGCHAHHDDPWSKGGLTDLANGRLLCPRHHRLAHDSRYAMTVHADNKVEFTRRT